MTDVPDIVWVAVAAPIGNPDHSSLLVVISRTQAVLSLSSSTCFRISSCLISYITLLA